MCDFVLPAFLYVDEKTPQARFDNSKAGGGKLQTQLDKQRGMTDAAALKQASEAQRRQRDLDQSATVLQHD